MQVFSYSRFLCRWWGQFWSFFCKFLGHTCQPQIVARRIIVSGWTELHLDTDIFWIKEEVKANNMLNK